MIPILFTALVVVGGPTIYCAYRSREFRKFLAGAFFVISGGIQFYLFSQTCQSRSWAQHLSRRQN
jgi:hypothetical protein